MNRIHTLALSLAVLAITGCASDTRFSAYGYNHFGQLGQWVGDGRLELTEKDIEGGSEASVRIVTDLARVSPCLNVRLKAHVWRDEETTTIITEPPNGVCEPVMYVIRNDGSGGAQYTQVAGAWAKEMANRDLTPKPTEAPTPNPSYGM